MIVTMREIGLQGLNIGGGRMTLDKFIENFVCRNTTIRLWQVQEDGTHTVVRDEWDENRRSWFMEWEMFKNDSFLNLYAGAKVMGVTDILDLEHPDAVNIVIN